MRGRPPIDGIRREGRMNFVFDPRLKTNLEKLARINELNTSRLVEKILQSYVDERMTDIQEYDRIVSKLNLQEYDRIVSKLKGK